MIDKLLTNDDIKIFDLLGKNHILMMFADQIIQHHPYVAASILLGISEVSDQHNPMIKQLITSDHFETPEVASEAIGIVLKGFNSELKRLAKLTRSNMKK
ncbi:MULTISPECIES: hypothetical protein [unclassified Acinetobacter]|uniref:hypothetical protein n=1 Tax=unclassified Acinetobacter TaxID=196816 RepID=UPI00244BC185|nr:MULTISPECIES: hypothetical protein [unclassified Acinetobacter]MDH0032532.1 hypothetical protein [Acinetobacter sp. GD04021]MDH0885223.1 hypothetical protein [Acinetobacter sp. GD03873]MDH1084449.1 hypothetical protein [Acinetobacter sp. GD03983]MDH2188337.1 hypothetical protein [Acinetobacter sp. GD03645]MDH2203848.1 hypothetical protein [Acinetobacter sp. GD03647]